MSDPTPTPGQKQTFAVDDLPTDWTSLDTAKKMDWLNTLGLKSDNTVNLGDCYRRGTKLTRIFSIVYKVIGRISEIVKKKGSAKVKKYLNSFIEALNKGIGHLSNYIYDNVTALLTTGKFSEVAAVPTPVSLPDLPTIGDDGPTKPTKTGSTFDTISIRSNFMILRKANIWPQSFWGIFVDTLTVLIGEWPWINQIQPGMVVSYGIQPDGYIIIPAPDSSEKGLLRVLIGPLPLFSTFT